MANYSWNLGFSAPNRKYAPAVWYDCSDVSTITKAYQNITPTGAGISGSTTITASASVTNIVPVGSKLRIDGTDIYTVSNVSTTTITTVETLTATYNAGSALALDKVSQINDKSGRGYHATQATIALQPVYVPNVQNGKSVVDFIQLGACMSIGNLNLGTAFTQVMLMKLDLSIANGDTFRRLFGMTNNNTFLFLRKATTNLEQKAVLTGQSENRSLLSYSAYDNTAWGIVISTINLSNRTIYLQDGTSNTTTNTTAASFQTATDIFGIGDIVDQTTIPGFKLGELLFYPQGVSPLQITNIDNNLENKWSIT